MEKDFITEKKENLLSGQTFIFYPVLGFDRIYQFV